MFVCCQYFPRISNESLSVVILNLSQLFIVIWNVSQLFILVDYLRTFLYSNVTYKNIQAHTPVFCSNQLYIKKIIIWGRELKALTLTPPLGCSAEWSIGVAYGSLTL